MITGKALATLTGLISDVLTPGPAGMDPNTSGEASAAGDQETWAADVVAAGVLDLLGDGVAAVTAVVPDAAGIAVIAGLVAAQRWRSGLPR